jgi:hypothetical protein
MVFNGSHTNFEAALFNLFYNLLNIIYFCWKYYKILPNFFEFYFFHLNFKKIIYLKNYR